MHIAYILGARPTNVWMAPVIAARWQIGQRRRVPHGEGTPLRLHLGCGPTVVPGWLNLDRSPSVLLSRAPRLRWALGKVGLLTSAQVEGFPRGAIRADLTKGIPYPTGSVEYIYTSHMIEHLSRWQALALLRECMRTLTPGGLIRCAVPDLRQLAASYLDGQITSSRALAADAFMVALNPRTEIEANAVQRFVWRNISGAQHQWMYDAESLSAMFEEAGFSTVRVSGYQESAMPNIDLLEMRPESVFVEASKSPSR